jgi:hypothetical protein
MESTQTKTTEERAANWKAFCKATGSRSSSTGASSLTDCTYGEDGSFFSSYSSALGVTAFSLKEWAAAVLIALVDAKS